MINTIKKGDKYWKGSSKRFKLLSVKKAIEIVVTPHTSMEFDYIDPTTLEIDRDWKDWKKYGGISLATWFSFWKIFIKNQDSIQLGGRWNPEKNIHEFCIYVNKKGTNNPLNDTIVEMRSGFPVTFKVEKKNAWEYRVSISNGEVTKEVIVEPGFSPKIHSLVGMYYGGANNAPGIWGGKAPKDMKCDQILTIK